MELDGINLEDVIETFELFDDWEDRYKYIIDLARRLPDFPEDKRKDEFKVRGHVGQMTLRLNFILMVIAMPTSLKVLWH
jgi:cysteine desulfuration protein SufE